MWTDDLLIFPFIFDMLCKLNLLEVDDWGLTLLGAALGEEELYKNMYSNLCLQTTAWPDAAGLFWESQQDSSHCLSEGKKNTRANATSEKQRSHSCSMPKQQLSKQ